MNNRPRLRLGLFAVLKWRSRKGHVSEAPFFSVIRQRLPSLPAQARACAAEVSELAHLSIWQVLTGHTRNRPG